MKYRSLSILLTFFLAGLFVVSCGKVAENESDIDDTFKALDEAAREDVVSTLEEDEDLKSSEIEEEVASAEETVGNSVSAAVEDEEEDDSSQSSYSAVSEPTGVEISKLKNFLKEGNFKAVIDSVDEDPVSYKERYYLGIAYYARMLMESRFSRSERVNFRDKAIFHLRKVGYEANEEELMAKGLLWYGMAVHLNYVSYEKKRQAVGAFHRIFSTKLKNTSVCNDAVFYYAKIHQVLQYYGAAKYSYKKLQNMDGRIYNPWLNKFENASDRGRKGVNLIEKITSQPSSADYESSESSVSASDDDVSETETVEETNETVSDTETADTTSASSETSTTDTNTTASEIETNSTTNTVDTSAETESTPTNSTTNTSADSLTL